MNGYKFGELFLNNVSVSSSISLSEANSGGWVELPFWLLYSFLESIEMILEDDWVRLNGFGSEGLLSGVNWWEACVVLGCIDAVVVVVVHVFETGATVEAADGWFRRGGAKGGNSSMDGLRGGIDLWVVVVVVVVIIAVGTILTVELWLGTLGGICGMPAGCLFDSAWMNWVWELIGGVWAPFRRVFWFILLFLVFVGNASGTGLCVVVVATGPTVVVVEPLEKKFRIFPKKVALVVVKWAGNGVVERGG